MSLITLFTWSLVHRTSVGVLFFCFVVASASAKLPPRLHGGAGVDHTRAGGGEGVDRAARRGEGEEEPSRRAPSAGIEACHNGGGGLLFGPMLSCLGQIR